LTTFLPAVEKSRRHSTQFSRRADLARLGATYGPSHKTCNIGVG
jgi:hypothetical protein